LWASRLHGQTAHCLRQQAQPCQLSGGCRYSQDTCISLEWGDQEHRHALPWRRDGCTVATDAGRHICPIWNSLCSVYNSGKLKETRKQGNKGDAQGVGATDSRPGHERSATRALPLVRQCSRRAGLEQSSLHGSSKRDK